MSSRINRRQLFKLGAVGGGVVASGGITAGVKTLSTSGWKEAHPGLNHPWWVKAVDKPTMMVDENKYSRFNGKDHVLYSFMKYVGREKAMKIFQNSRKKQPWWEWTFKALLIIWILFWLDIIIGSFKEMELRAAWIGIIILTISIALVLFLPVILRNKPWVKMKK